MSYFVDQDWDHKLAIEASRKTLTNERAVCSNKLFKASTMLSYKSDYFLKRSWIVLLLFLSCSILALVWQNLVLSLWKVCGMGEAVQ